MRRIRILYLISTGQVGGTERQAAMLVEGLDRNRFEPAVVLFRPGPLEERFRDVGPVTVLDKKKKLDPRFFVQLLRVLRRSAPDIVHTWDSTANLWGGLAARFAGIDHVVISEGELDLWKSWLWKRLDRMLGRWADVVVGNANAICRASEGRGVEPSKLRTIYNGVPPAGEGVGPSRTSTLIVLLGRIAPRKGHDVLLKALPTVLDRFGSVQVAIVGAAVHPGEPAFKKRLEGLVARMDLGETVEFWGLTGDPAGVLRRAAVLVVPSHSEGLPNVALEAMAVGTPVVATAVGGIPEAIEDRVSGLLIPPDNPEALAEAIVSVLSEPTDAASRAAVARKIVEERFSPQKMAKTWSDLYEEVLAQESRLSKSAV